MCRAFAFFGCRRLAPRLIGGESRPLSGVRSRAKAQTTLCFLWLLFTRPDSKGTIQIEVILAFLSQALNILSGTSKARSLR